jgi:hypothetical protein
MAKLRPLGSITDDMEPLILELVEGHQMQAQEIIYLIFSYLQAHTPSAFPIYEDGSTIEMYVGPRRE